jgi:hypothetical protein
MDWLLLLRLLDIIAVCASAGFLVAASLARRDGLPRHLVALTASYILFAFGSAAEIEAAIAADLPATWRTALVTLAAALGVAASAWTYWIWTGDGPLSDDGRDGEQDARGRP